MSSRTRLNGRAFAQRVGALVLCFATVSAVNAQETTDKRPAEFVATAANSALDHFREGSVPEALDALGPVADLNLSWSLDAAPLSAAPCGALHRALSPLSSEEQFDLLHKWTMPTESRMSVRILTAQVPMMAPPAEFARALGERPRSTSFSIADIGGVRGLFCTGWMLAQAAKDSGRLSRLIKDLEPLARDTVPNADILLWLARAVDQRVLDGELTLPLAQRITRLQELRSTPSPPPSAIAAIDPQDVLIAAVALERSGLRERSEWLFQELLETTANRAAPAVRPILQRAYATAVLRRRGTSNTEDVLSPQFSYWIAVPNSDPHDGNDAVWLEQEHYLLHLTGSRNDVLLFRYPVTGDFRFECETQSGGSIPTDGGLVYGGFSMFPHQTPSECTIWDAHGVTRMRRPNHYLRTHTRPTFNQQAVVHMGDTTTFEVNRHALWDVVHAATSPWLGLRTLGDGRPLFRHLKFSGNPVIPREVSLLAAEDTLGWQARTFGEPQPDWFTIPLVKPPAAVIDWSVSAGELRSPERPAEPEVPVRQSLLSYQRPLLDRESVTYEFRYQPGAQEVHPAIGRVAFVLQPEGVRLHWITDGAQEWTSLAADNTIVEPLNRRGPKPLPLKENDWNRVTVSRKGNDFTLSLNDTAVYQRELDAVGDHRFGFYRDSHRFGVHVRKVVLTGDWPTELPAEWRPASTTMAKSPLSDADRHALNHLFEDVNLADDVFAVRSKAAQLSPQARLDYLSEWILPGPNHAGFRLAGDFSPVDPFIENAADDSASEDRGGEVISPIYDWLDVSRELRALPSLRERALTTPEPKEAYQQRARVALLTLLHLEIGDETAAAETCTELLSLVKQATTTGIEDQWPETLVLFRAIPRFPKFGPVDDLLNYVYGQRTLRWIPANVHVWHTQLARLARRHRQTVEAAHQPSPAASPLPADWVPGSFMRSVSRGLGYAPAEWEFRNNVVTKISGHEQDFLFYRYPLSGNFEIECDLSNPGQFRNQVLQAGLCVGLHPSTTNYEVGRFGTNPVAKKLEPKLGNHPPWGRYRAVVRDGQLTVFLNGRQIHSEPIAEDAPPWVGLRAWGQLFPSARDFRITGHPTIPPAVPLATSADLLGWYAYNADVGVGAPSWALWKFTKDAADVSSGEMIGREFSAARGNAFENAVFYGRPLAEGEGVDYEFYYQPDRCEVHAAMDRTAFLFSPEGVQEHWITDARFERTGIDPANRQEHSEFRRGTGPLPLRANEWNQCAIALRDGKIQLRLNDQLVYERPFQPDRQQTFGLFYFADLTEARVRKIFMRGDWPQSLPSMAEQSLARSPVDEIDADRSHMKLVFEHDFSKHGVPGKYFLWPTLTADMTMQPRPNGLFLQRKTHGTWGSVDVNPRFSMSGDFDVELEFDELQTPSDKDSGLALTVQLDTENQMQYRIIRTRTSAGTQELYLSNTFLTTGNNRVYHTLDHLTCEVNRGRLRLSRRASNMHFLFAEGDSSNYRLLWTEPASTHPTDPRGIGITAVCNGVGNSACLVKHLLVRAESIQWHPELTVAGPRALFVMKPNGTGLKSIVLPPAVGYQVVGSAEFSRDGKQIAMDMSQGSTATSHLIVCNADGSGIRDLGPGCMPSFSPDGKQFVFSHDGVMIVNADGTNRQVLDGAGWGTQWSPDGKWIAYGKSGNVVLMDPNTRATRTLLTGDDAQRYGSIYWNLGWSHDSQTVGFKARRRSDGEDEVAIIDVNKPQGLHILLSKVKGINPDITFTAANDGVVFGMHNPKVKGSQLHVIYRNKPEEIKVLPNQPANLRIIDAHWSRDGRWLTFSGHQVPEPLEWTAELAAKKLLE